MNKPDKKKEIKLNINIEQLLLLYLHKEYDKLSEKFIDILNYFWEAEYLELSNEEKKHINMLVETFLYLITKADYVLNEKYAEKFIRLNPVISNITAISGYKNTDTQISILLDFENDKSNFIKVLTLYSSRNKIRLDYKKLFTINPKYASLWYINYLLLASYPSDVMDESIKNHINNIDDKFIIINYNLQGPYFIATYYSPDNDKKIRQNINNSIKKSHNIKVENKPNKNKIAIITSKWAKNNVIYNSYCDFFKTLKTSYDLTLIHLGPEAENQDTGLFNKVENVRFTNEEGSFNPVFKNDFKLIFYPDIGMSKESLYLANLRIAPIQVTGYGHPVSTFGSEIDYFIGGQDVDIADNAEQNYSERLVLIPGIGLNRQYPDFKINKPESHDQFIINCPWMCMKTNYNMLKILADIINRSDKKIIYRFYPSLRVQKENNFIPFENTLKSILGKDNLEIITQKDYKEYMSLMNEGNISIYSYPFGGYFTVIDSIYLAKPPVVMEGDKAYNRLASAVLKKTGLHELIAVNESEYIEKISKLINDDEYRHNISNKIKNTDLKAKLFNPNEAKYFKKAIDYLMVNHDKLKNENSKTPVIIPA